MKVIIHALASTFLSLLVYAYSNSFEVSILCFLLGVFIDVDHALDYLMWSNNRSLRTFFKLGPDYFTNPHSTDRVLHSIDLWLPLILFTMVILPELAIGVAVGFIGHITLDFLGFSSSPFLLHRVLRWKNQVVELRKTVLERDGYRCRDCGAASTLQMHNERNFSCTKWNKLRDWVSLCERCHMSRHGSGMFY